MFVALEPRRLYRQVAEQIRVLIDTGELEAGFEASARTRACRAIFRFPTDSPRGLDRA